MTLFRTGDIIMVMLMLGMAFWTYDVKYEAQRRYQDVRVLNRQIEVEQDSANVLRARWALATEPERIARLAKQYHEELQLEDISPRQIVRARDIPARLPDAVEIAIKENSPPPGADDSGTGSPGTDSIVTAGIGKSDKSAADISGAGGKSPPPGAKQAALPPMGKTAPKRKTWTRQPPYIMPNAAKPGAVMPAGSKAL